MKRKWLQKNSFLISGDEYVETFEKYQIEASFMIDDYWQNFKGFCGTTILFEQPWNKSHREGWDLVSSDWEQIYYWLANRKGVG